MAPHNRWPQHITDVKTAIAWARANVDRFGGDRNFVAIAGCSAGGHLSALAGLTANDPEMQAELPEGSDTSVDAVVGIYGRYDWEDRSTAERARFVDFLERVVVKRKIDRSTRRSSARRRRSRRSIPMRRRSWSSTAPATASFPVAQARSFVERLRAVSRSVVSYIELPGAGHGVRHDRRRPHRVGGDRNRLVPQPDSPKPVADRGPKRLYRRLRVGR